MSVYYRYSLRKLTKLKKTSYITLHQLNEFFAKSYTSSQNIILILFAYKIAKKSTPTTRAAQLATAVLMDFGNAFRHGSLGLIQSAYKRRHKGGGGERRGGGTTGG